MQSGSSERFIVLFGLVALKALEMDSAKVEAILGSPLLWGFIGLVAIAVALSGRLDVTAAKWVLVGAWTMAIFSVYRFDPMLRQSIIARSLWVIMISAGIGLALYYLSAWMENRPSSVAPPISIVRITLEPRYEVDKPVHIVIKLNNTIPGLKVRGLQTFFVGKISGDSFSKLDRRLDMERKFWQEYEQNARTEMPMSLSCVAGVVMIPIDGPPLNENAVEHLNGPDGFVYVMGQLDYGSGALDYCAQIRSSDPTTATLCIDHNGPAPRPAFK